MAYGWCAVIWENRQSYKDWKTLLFLSLEVGFRCPDPRKRGYYLDLTHTEHHRELADAVFKSGRSEAIADFLFAMNTYRPFSKSAIRSFDVCKHLIVDLQNNLATPFSTRLRQLVMRSIVLIGYKGFEEVGIEKFIRLLNRLCFGVEEMDVPQGWRSILLETIQSPEGPRNLAVHSWELLAKPTALDRRGFRRTTYTPDVTSSLLGAQEWDKLECWMGFWGMIWSPMNSRNIKEDLEHAMGLLFRQRPGAPQKLTERIEKYRSLPEYFRQICQRAHGASLYALFRVHGILSEFHTGFCFILGRACHPTKGTKNLRGPQRSEVINSGRCYR